MICAVKLSLNKHILHVFIIGNQSFYLTTIFTMPTKCKEDKV